MNILIVGAAGNVAQKGIKPIFREMAQHFLPNSYKDVKLIGVDIKEDDNIISQGFDEYHTLDVTDINADNWRVFENVDVVIDALMAITSDIEVARAINVGGITNICAKVEEYDIKRITHCGTFSEYAEPYFSQWEGLTENWETHTPTPRGTYSITKYEQILVLREFAKKTRKDGTPFEVAVPVLLGVTETPSVGLKTWGECFESCQGFDQNGNVKRSNGFVHVKDTARLILYCTFTHSDKVFPNQEYRFRRFFSGQTDRPENNWDMTNSKSIGYFSSYNASNLQKPK
tara:strand:+ start:829 stop:1689 length:861 start_codon:yes stop_codon:yes gene_type:complete